MLTQNASAIFLPEETAETTTYLFNSGSCKYDTEMSRQLAVKQAIRTMRTRFQDPLTLSEIADSAQLSAFHFNRIFRNIVGVPPSVYLAALRIEQAKKLLLRTTLSVTSICFDVGYNSLGTFTTRFTQFVGANPTHLRRLCQDKELSTFFRDWEHLKNNLGVLQCSREKSAIRGYIDVSQPFDGLIFVGAFRDPIPQGTPIGCTILAGSGDYAITTLPQGKYYLFAAAFQRSDDFIQMLEGSASQRYADQHPISIYQEDIQNTVYIKLLPMSWTDPPILTALPLLLMLRLRQYS